LYFLALIACGVFWFLVAGVLGQGVPIFGQLWLQHLIVAIVTALVIGYLFKKPLERWQQWLWYVLPILTLLVASALFGLLVAVSWGLTEMMKSKGIDGEAFYLLPGLFVLYSMTTYLVVLYPLALLTQTLLRRFCLPRPQALTADSR
jgi:hypothetical protein